MFRLLLALLFLNACGDDCKYDSAKRECNEDSNVLAVTTFEIKGTVMGAFEVEVDGGQYDDIETFYSEELKALPAKIEAAGYVGYTPSFEAEIGFKDLTNQMLVFVSSIGKRGYASKAYVNGNDTFEVSFPADAAEDAYQIRAVKRIGLILSKDNEKLGFCYNFSAVEAEVSYDQIDKPVILNSFETKITEYDCEKTQKEDGMEIPARS